jgi:hypothetical protein
MTERPRWRTSIAAIWTVGYLACSSNAGPASTSSGLERTITLPTLTPAQGAQLCDWANRVLGGYGRTVACPAGMRATDRDQAYCVDGLQSCPTLTVADIEDCSLAQGADVCKYFTANACATIRQCIAE